MSAPLLAVEGLCAGYGGTPVLRGVDLAVPERARVGLFGPNGHGKTTLLRAVSGLVRPTAGAIRFAGRRIDGLKPGRIVELGVVHVPQANTLFPRLTVDEALSLGSFARRARAGAAQNLERAFALFPRLAERRRQLCGTLSGGERQMLAVSLGVLSAPRLLILDEPTLGLAPRIKDELCEAVRALASADMTLIVVEQDVEFLTGLVDTLFMVEHGAVVREIAPGGLDGSEVMRLYFGQAESAAPAGSARVGSAFADGPLRI